MDESALRGINPSKEDEDFVRYFAIVHGEASKRGCVFFLGEFECHDLVLEDMYLTEMEGWLIPNELADEFEAIWKKRKLKPWDSEWSEYYVSEFFDYNYSDGTIEISFCKYTDDGDVWL